MFSRFLLWPLWLLALAWPGPSLGQTQSHAEFIFQGSNLNGSVLLTPFDPNAPPAVPATPSCPAGQRWDTALGACQNPCDHLGNRLVWFESLGACVSDINHVDQYELRPCRLANNAPSQQIWTRRITTYLIRLNNGRRDKITDDSDEWKPWKPCGEGQIPTGPTTPPALEPGPAVGTPFTITALICGPDDTGYDSALGAAWAKSQVINYYRNFGASRRCPEAGGFQHWLQNWHNKAVAWVQTYGMWHDFALGETWPEIRRYMDDAATANRERDPPLGDSGIPAAHQLCLQAARARWPGFGGTASYQIGSGNQCLITTL